MYGALEFKYKLSDASAFLIDVLYWDCLKKKVRKYWTSIISNHMVDLTSVVIIIIIGGFLQVILGIKARY